MLFFTADVWVFNGNYSCRKFGVQPSKSCGILSIYLSGKLLNASTNIMWKSRETEEVYMSGQVTVTTHVAHTPSNYSMSRVLLNYIQTKTGNFFKRQVTITITTIIIITSTTVLINPFSIGCNFITKRVSDYVSRAL